MERIFILLPTELDEDGRPAYPSQWYEIQDLSKLDINRLPIGTLIVNTTDTKILEEYKEMRLKEYI